MLEIQQRALRELSKPAALLLPKPVRDVIVDLLALVADQDRRITNLERAGLGAGPLSEGGGHGEGQSRRG
ncbi:MAG: hypothetical protein ACYCVW_17055 [Rhodocyclaceae bacterium]